MMCELSNRKLVEEIEATRQSMISIGLEYGLTHSYTVKLSTKLDDLLNELLKTNNREIVLACYHENRVLTEVGN
ncbi:aspartyl-phosphate phosphatase Spo0E family protein [Metabacillus bambusae]|uniref:Aspartyl-phosphate phosphatase Spo0E family protein n=1 Tax=Metabacillus bambusae TaxID=2795218 RepID=A0ABS3N0R4_9BACI|nr:aspartyl-phosphate phosphatase Spo0E family protein [Metabacillus bambusae]MBO1511845.1 aspartyl-phosphate phosphatase Spo0E family protein [Metabacillus bambusae]